MRRARIASTVVASAAVVALLAPELAPAASKAGRPTNFTITVSGQRLTAKQLSAAVDTYIPVRTGPLTIGVRWTTDLRGTNHRVIITSSGGTDRKRCLSGTSCTLATKWSLRPTQETSWSVLIYNGTKLVSEKALCLVGKS
jgi:hypothetical protein